MQNKRKDEYDFVKGVLIMAVLMGHYNFLQWPTEIQSWGWNINETIYLFHMPLFFAVGVIFCKKFTLENLKKDALRILLPFFIYLWRPDFLFNPIESYHQIKSVLPRFLYGNHPHGTGILWYLPTIFLLKTWFSLFKKWEDSNVGHKYLRIGFILLLSLVSILNSSQLGEHDFFAKTPWGFYTSIYLFCLSYGIFQLDRWKRFQDSIRGPFVISILFGYLSMNLLSPQGVHRVDLAQFIVPHQLEYTLIWFVFLASLFLFLRNLGKRTGFIFSALKLCGYFSFPIFLYHEMFLGHFDRAWVIQGLQPSWLYLPLALLVICATMVASIFLSELLIALLPSLEWIGLCSHPSIRNWVQSKLIQVQKLRS